MIIVLSIVLIITGLAIIITIICTILIIVTCLQNQWNSYQNKKKFKDDIDLLDVKEGKNLLAKIKINSKLFNIDIKKMVILKKIGSGGSNSHIYKGKWNGHIVAFKCFNTSDLCNSKDDFTTFEKEIGILGSLSHPNILIFYGGTLNPPRVGIVTEFCTNGDLKEYLKKNIDVTIKKRLEWIKGIVSGMDYLHSRNVIHRDLKPDNVLLSDKFIPKIIDFGISTFYEENVERTTRIGTSCYIAPEVVMNSNYTEKCDVFSFAILFFGVITNNCVNPFGDVPLFNIELKIATIHDFRPNINKIKVESKYKWIVSLISQCWDDDPEKRPSFEKILELFNKKIQLE